MTQQQGLKHYKAATDDETHRTSLTQKIFGCYDTSLSRDRDAAYSNDTQK